ncbi:immunity 22 family protein [Chryseobacterium sp. Ch-15]|uniref:Immunity 22 family protein n=1 Tax=Chryseobacterium muglaense TaxID=2893752 RepID=A0A9Q3YQR2_9FLAO|nr:immunity 22 family protein [Chryseobacterium muglaense]MBD3905220.1 immunity 22 family protein [Chryseobacterium muglaense]MCC9034074.1 immunity 22 family protein [Chryseobacterium muglaense]MCM2555067.1 immunity 22 family protein [Chryseobacterium muglaense]
MNTQVLDFWVGNFRTEEDFFQFVEEDENYYIEEESDDTYISKFAESQDTVWFDQDLMEYGFEQSIQHFSEYSFADQWLPVLYNRLNEMNLKFDINSLVFVSQGQIPQPKSIENDDFSLVYVGGIEFEY